MTSATLTRKFFVEVVAGGLPCLRWRGGLPLLCSLSIAFVLAPELEAITHTLIFPVSYLVRLRVRVCSVAMIMSACVRKAEQAGAGSSPGGLGAEQTDFNEVTFFKVALLWYLLISICIASTFCLANCD